LRGFAILPLWIAVSGPTNVTCETAAFVRPFSLEKRTVHATWKVSGLGVFRCFVNGTEIGADDLLKPGYTDVYKCRHVSAYDVTDALVRTNGARNVLSALVSAGWWRDRSINREDMDSLKSAFRGELLLTYADGTTGRIVTDSSWLAAYEGPVRHATIYDGEDYDARVETGWMRTGDVGWPAAAPYDGVFTGEVRDRVGPPVRLRRDLTLEPKTGASFQLEEGESRIVDFGQNAAAVPELVFSGARGTVVDIDFAEMLNDSGEASRGNDGPKGSLYRANYRTAKSHVRYVFRGEGDETYRPTLTYFGYRYARICVSGPVKVKSFRSVPLSSVSAAAECGTLETDNPLLNRLVENVRWGARSNFVSVPTDCPQRDERAGWSADTQVFAPTALYLAEMNGFYRKWMADMNDSQLPDGAYCQVAPFRRPWSGGPTAGWSDAGVIVPYITWQMTGDRRIVDENWGAMGRYMACIRAHKGPWRRWWGDHLSYERNDDALKEFLQYAFWLYDAQLMARMARATGRADEATAFEADAQEARQLMGACRAPCQTEYAYRLFLGLDTGADAVRTADALCANIAAHGGKLQTGFLGTAVLLDALVGAGCIETAYDVLLNRGEPGWLFTVDQGATTMWERWNSYTAEKGFGDANMNSFNHYAYGAVLGWMYRSMAGIGLAAVPTEGGSFVLAPKPDPRRRIGRVACTWRSAWGEVKSAWRYDADGTWIWEYAIPAGAEAQVVLPDGRTFRCAAGRHRESVSLMKGEQK